MSGDNADILIVGGGLAGLTLARHLLLETDRRVLLLERRAELPPSRQKVGESTVQVGGYYLSRVLRLEEHLLTEHFMKYNLRFYWKSAEGSAERFQDYSQTFIRPFSNVASYQLDRNKLEAELARLCGESPRFQMVTGARKLTADLAAAGPHRVAWESGGESREVAAEWVIDASGRGRFLARRRELEEPNEIDHGAFFWWVEGLVDVEALTDLSPREVRLHPGRRQLGHLPMWLATNHFMGEGFWFWVIPLQGKTSLGLVYDRSRVAEDDVFSVEKATRWVCREFPLFARDLPRREVLDFGGYKSFSYGCRLTLDPARWAITGEAGRFSDPLYSPGSDLIAFHNTLIVAAIGAGEKTGAAAAAESSPDLANRCLLSEQLMRAVYEAYLPSYDASYDALGDQETFVLKYTWELAVYFGFYVFPFVNDLVTDRRFAVAFLRAFSRLGPINRCLHAFLSDYFQWKKKNGRAGEKAARRHVELLESGALAAAEKTFYRVGVTVEEAKQVLREQLENAEELARFVLARVSAAVLDEPEALDAAGFVAALDPRRQRFDPEELRRLYEEHRGEGDGEIWRWRLAVPDLGPLATEEETAR